MKNTALTAFAASAALFVLAIFAAPAFADTQAYIRPGYLDAVLYNPVGGTLYLDAVSPGTYRVDITGVPQDWLSYQKTVRVDGSGTGTMAYVVEPKAAGKYTLLMTVNGPGGTFDLEERLWVGNAGAAGQAGSGDARSANTGSGAEPSGDLTGMFTMTKQDAAMGIYAVTILTIIFVLLAGHFTLKREEGPTAS
jgi:hypothetical protein